MRTVVHFIDSRCFGGTERILLSLLIGLDRDRWRSVLFYHPEPGLTPLVEGARRRGTELRALPRMRGLGRALPRMARFLRALRLEQASVFHAHLNWPPACRHGLLAAALARVPAVVATAQLFPDPIGRRERYAQRIICRGVDRYIAVSEDMARRLRAYLRVPERKVRVVRNGIELAPYERPPDQRLRGTLALGSARPLVLCPARLDRQKGLSYLLEAAAMVPEATFLLAGDGPERAALEAQARGLGLGERVVFLGYREDVPDLLAACDLFVLPSLFEGLPLSVLEAAAAGIPVIATAIGGTDESVRHGETGLLVPPADPGALAAAVRTLLADPPLARQLAASGKARVRQEFAAETMVRRVSDVYEEVLASGEARHDAD